MKTSILMLALMFAVFLEINAQQSNQLLNDSDYGTTNSAALLKNYSFAKNSFDPGNNDPAKDYDFYMSRSKKQRTVGWITLSAGIIISGFGVLVGTGNIVLSDRDETGEIIMGIGALSGIVSIPFMIMATVNKKIAKLTVGNQKTGFGAPSTVSKDITGITLQIPLGK